MPIFLFLEVTSMTINQELSGLYINNVYPKISRLGSENYNMLQNLIMKSFNSRHAYIKDQQTGEGEKGQEVRKKIHVFFHMSILDLAKM